MEAKLILHCKYFPSLRPGLNIDYLMQCAREGYVLASSRTATSKADRPLTTHTKVQYSNWGAVLKQSYSNIRGYYCLYYRGLLIPSCWWGRGRMRMLLWRSSQTVWQTLLRPKYACMVEVW